MDLPSGFGDSPAIKGISGEAENPLSTGLDCPGDGIGALNRDLHHILGESVRADDVPEIAPGNVRSSF
jgi:hypothetical protein